MKQVKEKIESSVSKWAKDIIKFSFKKNKATTKDEKELAKSIQDIKNRGRFVHIPND